MPATDRVAPERGIQGALGLAGSSVSGRTTWTVEAYARTMRGLVAYREGALFSSPFDDWQDLVVTGQGRSRGVEAFVQHRTDRLAAWLGYTLARTDRQFDEVNGGEWFPFRYDRTHDISASAVYTANKRFDLSASWTFGTGDAVTLPRAEFESPRFNSGNVSDWVQAMATGGFSNGSQTATAFSSRNGFRLPAYHRLDLGATLYFRRGTRPHALALNVYNAYNRKNTFITLLQDQRGDYNPNTGTQERTRQLTGIAIFPVLPTLSYQFAF